MALFQNFHLLDQSRVKSVMRVGGVNGWATSQSIWSLACKFATFLHTWVEEGTRVWCTSWSVRLTNIGTHWFMTLVTTVHQEWSWSSDTVDWLAHSGVYPILVYASFEFLTHSVTSLFTLLSALNTLITFSQSFPSMALSDLSTTHSNGVSVRSV